MSEGLEHSKRTYKVCYSLSNDKLHYEEVYTISEICMNQDDLELHYGIQENLDQLLDLKINDAMTFLPNRDDFNSAGFIKRIK